MRLPPARGPVSDRLIGTLPTPPSRAHPAPGPLPDRDASGAAADEDLQLALHVCYELHYRGWEGVPDEWEWDPGLLAFRASLERWFEADLRTGVAAPLLHGTDTGPGTVGIAEALKRLTEQEYGPPLAAHLQRDADAEEFREFVIHRSVYQLKEGDPHVWAVPRIAGPAKAALVEILADEYGGGRAERMHAELFRRTMRGLGLADTYGHYLARVPAVTLATSNAISLFGLHRRLRGALVGHLAAFEMTSSLPNRRYGNGLRRIGGTPADTDFYDEHVTADAVHEQIAAHDVCGALVGAEPALTEDVLFGAACALALDARMAEHLLGHWRQGVSSLLTGGRPRMSEV
ncbi:iron-containing redox enzyme family protein [Streptomyces sp. NPDC057554]|uniref:iron-containing redox enzyme family protein n=1 Tax=Streptomyces sp. NPDC057554 TaxID=3350538 RepID=UPI003683BFD6